MLPSREHSRLRSRPHEYNIASIRRLSGGKATTNRNRHMLNQDGDLQRRDSRNANLGYTGTGIRQENEVESRIRVNSS